MSSPVEPVVTDELLEDLTASLDDAAAAEPEATPSPEGQPAEAQAPPPDQPIETLEPSSPVKPAGAPAAPPVPPPAPTFAPPVGEPLTLRVDRNAIPLPGAVQTPDGGWYLSPDAVRKVQANYLGDRSGWQQKERGFQAQLQAERSRKSEAESRASAFNAEMAARMDKGPEAMAEWLDNFALNRPILEANMKARMLEEKLQAREAEDQQRSQEQQAADLLPALQQHLEKAFTVKLQDERYKGLSGPELQRFKDHVWDVYGEALFFEDATGVHFHEDKFDALLGYEAARQQKVAQTTTTITQAAKRNAAATAPVKPVAKPAERPRKPNGQFTEEPFDKDEFLRKTTFF